MNLWMLRAHVLLILLLALLCSPVVQQPASAQTPGCGSKNEARACGDASADGFGIAITNGPSADVAEVAVDGPSLAGRPRPVVVRELTHEPTCSLNRPENGGALCLGAVNTCPGVGDIAYWVYVRNRNMVTGAVSAWERVLDPPYTCIGATEPPPPTVPIEVLIGQELARDFANLPLPRAVVVVKPEGKTLINIPTRFLTGEGTTQLAPMTVLGRQVLVTAIADRYDWNMGDGTSQSDAGPGSTTRPIEHTYRAPARVGPKVSITWSGTFTVQGIPGSYPIVGTATTTGPPADLQVLGSRTQLVAKE